MPQHWLMKAEPDSRIVKGKDVKFSVDDFENMKSTPWEGVRNHEAKNLMKEMKIGDKVLFYHSNCKTPGVAGFAEVSRESYPDYTAWDSAHPYFDAKSDKDAPRWYMVDLTFVARAKHFVPLALFRRIADSADIPADVEYIGKSGLSAIKTMALVNRGRLSVQRVTEKAYETVQQLADQGGWADTPAKQPAVTRPPKGKAKRKRKTSVQGQGNADGGESPMTDVPTETDGDDEAAATKPRKRSKKVQQADETSTKPGSRVQRRSSRRSNNKS